jgi:hypothetical protein
MVIAVVGFAGFLVGALISTVLCVGALVLVIRDAKKRCHGWWIFGLTTAIVLPCALLLVHSRPTTINLPNTIDLKNFFLNCIGYAGSPGFAAAIACVMTFLIPRPKRSVPPPLPTKHN